jgi:hypothetical protein
MTEIASQINSEPEVQDAEPISSSDAETRLQCPKTSRNQLRDIIDWLGMGDVIVLHHGGNGPQIYHKEPNNVQLDLDIIRVIFVDCSNMPGLLHEGEWPWYINAAGFKLCCEALTNRIIEIQTTLKYSYTFRVR